MHLQKKSKPKCQAGLMQKILSFIKTPLGRWEMQALLLLSIARCLIVFGSQIKKQFDIKIQLQGILWDIQLQLVMFVGIKSN